MAIKVSSEFAESAREAASAADRSLTGQVEHWAKIGRAAEAIIPAPVAAALKLCAGDINAIEDASMRQRVLEALAALQAQNHFAETRQHLTRLGQPLFEADPEDSGGILRVESDGTRTRGRMEGRKFIPRS